jgi:hypothetical protein
MTGCLHSIIAGLMVVILNRAITVVFETSLSE